MNNTICTCADVLNFKYRGVKILVLKLEAELPNLVKQSRFVLK